MANCAYNRIRFECYCLSIKFRPTGGVYCSFFLSIYFGTSPPTILSDFQSVNFMATRQVLKFYQDPLELLWIACARQLGIEIVRDDEVFASWDGRGTLRIGLDSLDSDDSLAQMILHELCHAIVEGPGGYDQPDWGLNESPAKSRVHEFAALRLQAALADEFGLRHFFSATTDFHEYYQALSTSPLDEQNDPKHNYRIIRPVTPDEDLAALQLARKGYSDWERSNWKKPMEAALQATRKIFDFVNEIAPADSLWKAIPGT